jgi:hypothetical protein
VSCPFPPVYPTLNVPLHLKLHASDLRALATSSAIAVRLQDSPSSIQLPYVRSAPGADSIQHLADNVAQRCGAQRFDFPIGASALAAATETTFDSGSKHVLCLSMPVLTESAGARKRSVAEHGAYYSLSLRSLPNTRYELTRTTYQRFALSMSSRS